VSWTAAPENDGSRASFRRFLDVVMTYGGTRSLPRDLVAAEERPVAPGDVFLQPGSPGHAMIVVDVAARGDERAFLLAQSYMPAQEVHVVRGPAGGRLGAWYAHGPGADVVTPEWTFRDGRRRMRFAE
jgi:hypothetical protein